jgi:hypothetical protein
MSIWSTDFDVLKVKFTYRLPGLISRFPVSI